jgi:hypothetical protein
LIEANRVLRRDLDHLPDFAHVPVGFEDVPVDPDEDEMALLETMTATGGYGAAATEAPCFILFAWWNEAFLGVQTRLGRP